MNLEELKKQYAQLGEEIKRLEDKPEITYAFTAFISNFNSSKKDWVFWEGKSPQNKVIILNHLGGASIDLCYGFARAYRVGDTDFIIDNNTDSDSVTEPQLTSMDSANSIPSDSVQEKHKAAIRRYLDQWPQFRVEEVDQAIKMFITQSCYNGEFPIGLVKIVDNKNGAFINGVIYQSTSNKYGNLSLIKDDDNMLCPNDDSIVELHPDFYAKLKPFINDKERLN
jgi:hypothetical protein